MEQVDIIEDSHLPAAQVVTIVLPSIPHDDSGTLQATPGTYESSQQETVSIDSHELPLATTTIQLTQVQSAVPLEVLKENPQASDTSDNQNLVVVGVQHHQAVALGHRSDSPSATTHHQDPYHHHHHHHHHHHNHHQQHHHHHQHHHNQHDDDDHEEEEEEDHHHLEQKPGTGGEGSASSKSRTRFKWTKESAQVALNLVKHGCKPVLVSVAVGCSLRTAQKFVEIVKPKMEGDAFKDYEIKRRGRKSRDVNQRLEAIREVLSKDVSKTQVQIAADLKVSNTTVCRDIKRIGASWKRTEASASAATTTATDHQNTPGKADPTSKRQPPTASNRKSGRSSSQTQKRNTPNSIAANNNDNQNNSVNNTTNTAAATTATTTSNCNNSDSATTTTTSGLTATNNVAPKHELAQQVHA